MRFENVNVKSLSSIINCNLTIKFIVFDNQYLQKSSTIKLLQISI